MSSSRRVPWQQPNDLLASTSKLGGFAVKLTGLNTNKAKLDSLETKLPVAMGDLETKVYTDFDNAILILANKAL